jgi:predicted regulator of amino acid metabolism with ACT domain
MRWSVAQTKTQSTDLRIIQGHYPWCVTTELGEHVALVKSQKKANTGFAKASGVNDRDNAYETAELISAAPELYNALENLVNRNLIKETDKDHYDEVLAALRKAKPN